MRLGLAPFFFPEYSRGRGVIWMVKDGVYVLTHSFLTVWVLCWRRRRIHLFRFTDKCAILMGFSAFGMRSLKMGFYYFR